MQLPATIPKQSAPHSSVLGSVVSSDPVLGELLVSIARWYVLGRAIAEVSAELAALRASKWTAPTFEVVASAPVNCIHGLREDWCAFCNSNRDYLAPKMPMEAKRSRSARKHFAGLESVSISYEQGTELKGDRRVAFRSFNAAAMGPPERAWLRRQATHEPACLRRGVEPRTSEVRPQFGAGGHSIPITIDARSKTLCPLCDKLLAEGRYICEFHSTKYVELLKAGWERHLKATQKAVELVKKLKAESGEALRRDLATMHRAGCLYRMWLKGKVSYKALRIALRSAMQVMDKEQGQANNLPNSMEATR